MVDLSAEERAQLDALAPLIAKVSSAFLETRWFWPRRFTVVSASAFMLSDPRAQHLDGRELQRLAEELQLKLFGVSDEGEVALLLFEGDEADMAAFMGMPSDNLLAAIEDGSWPSEGGGSLRRITSMGEEAVIGPSLSSPPRASGEGAAPAPAPPPPPDHAMHFRGIYFAMRETFVGSVVAPSRPEAAISFSMVDGPDRLPVDFPSLFDTECVEAGAKLLAADNFSGLLAFPVSFSAMARRSTRETYAEALRKLACYKKSQLAALVYDVPRAPSFQAVAQLKAVLERHFGMIDLYTTDPNFEVERLPTGAVNFVTLMLPEAKDRERYAAVRRFMERREIFKRNKIWPAVSNVRSAADLQFCAQERVPFITGSAVCAPQGAPVGGTPYAASQLPYQA